MIAWCAAALLLSVVLLGISCISIRRWKEQEFSATVAYYALWAYMETRGYTLPNEQDMEPLLIGVAGALERKRAERPSGCCAQECKGGVSKVGNHDL